MRLIDADEINELFYEYGATDLMDAFDDALQDCHVVDAVPVIRCENCKHYALWNNGWAMHHCDRHDRTAHDQDYCSYGERWDDNG